MYLPKRYFTGLTTIEKKQRIRRMKEGLKTKSNNPKSYRAFKTDRGKKTRSSKYTVAFYKKYPGAKSLAQKAKATGVPLKTIKRVYNRGMAAWRTGHRPGATQQQWGYARVHSFLTKGKTYYTSDSDLSR